MAKKGKQDGGKAGTDKMIVAGGNFIRAHYKLPPLGEDIKNAIVALFQFLVSGQRMNGPVSVEAMDDMSVIHTDYGDVSVNRVEHPVNRKLQTKFIFTVPMQFFIKGRRSDGKIYRNMVEALHALAECRFTFAGQTVKGFSGTTAPIGMAGTLTPTAVVTDSRGRTTSVSAAAVSVFDYQTPSMQT